MKFNLHHGDYPFEKIPNVVIEAETDGDALTEALLKHATDENPHPVVSPVDDGHAGYH